MSGSDKYPETITLREVLKKRTTSQRQKNIIMQRFLPFILLLAFTACNRGATHYKFPTPVDTRTKAINFQEKKTYDFPILGLKADNQFDGARLNTAELKDDTLLVIGILPENEPINPSPWYALRLTPERDQRLTVRLQYGNGVNHRYFPKVSTDRKNWSQVDSTTVKVATTKNHADIRLNLTAGQPVFLAGQEVINSSDVQEWQAGLVRKYSLVNPFPGGKSKLGRDLPAFSIRNSAADTRPTIVLLSRQHPPEVTGFLCLQAFLDGLLEHPRLEELLAKYQFLVYPLLNPDGVDLGHWRHTAGGIDSNRDWAKYNQPEAHPGSRIVLGMDFHSTWHDVYYTHLDEVQPPTALPGFKDAWLAAIEEGIGGDFKINEEAALVRKPTTASWFRTQFGAEGITYEIGDGTPREFVALKGRVSAGALVEVLLAR